MRLCKLILDPQVKQININTALLSLIVPALVYLDGTMKQLNDKLAGLDVRVARIEQQLVDKKADSQAETKKSYIP